MPHAFGTTPQVRKSRSVFRTDRTYKTTFDAGLLIPFYVDEILPGDTVNFNGTLLARFNTPLTPVMDNMYLDTHFFFVPNRLVWENWERFCGAQDNPGDSVDFLIPKVTNPSAPFPRGSIADYFGIPVTAINLAVNALPFRAYNLIYNEFFRDQDLIDSVVVPRDDGPDNISDFPLQRRAKRPDYFTTCRPFLQKGPEVTMPLGLTAPVVGNGKALGLTDASANFGLGVTGGGTLSAYSGNRGDPIGTTNSGSILASSKAVGVTGDPNLSGLKADLLNATASSINTLRLAFLQQAKYEIDARSGTRYVEYLYAHFGVVSPDFRLQRPEYLGGASQRLDFHSVPATTQNADKDLGDLAAFGISTGTGHDFVKSFVEHGFVIGLVSARADITYQRGLHRMWSRSTIDDYYLPIYAHLGEQAVLNSEIFAQGTSADDGVFGYQERWSEYRYGVSMITGKLRSTDPQSLDVWHLSQEFSSLPTLSKTFIEDNPPVDRVVAVPSEPHFIFDSYLSIRHTRAMPVRSIPAMLNHF